MKIPIHYKRWYTSMLSSMLFVGATSSAGAVPIGQNPFLPWDVDFDGTVSINDSLEVISHLQHNRPNPTPPPLALPPPFLDPDGNGVVSIDDVTSVIFQLRRISQGIVPAPHTIDFQLVITEEFLSPITSVAVGEEFMLRAYVHDTRPEPAGVKEAFIDVTYASSNVTIGGPLMLGPGFPNIGTPEYTLGQIAAAGGSSSAESTLDLEPQLLFSIPFRATAAGIVNFLPELASPDPANAVFVYDISAALPSAYLSFLGTTLTIVSEPSSLLIAAVGFVGMITWGRRRRWLACCDGCPGEIFS